MGYSLSMADETRMTGRLVDNGFEGENRSQARCPERLAQRARAGAQRGVSVLEKS